MRLTACAPVPAPVRRCGLTLVLTLVLGSAVAQPCGDWVVRLPGPAQALCEAAALQPVAPRSVRGQPLLAADVAPAPEAERQGLAPLRVLVLGGLHGDEPSSVSLVLQWLAWATEQPGAVQWRFLPLVNPDGLLHSPSTRTNAHGVDLNRNFPTPGWAREAPRHWAQRTRRDPRRWPGPQALSEPESRWVHDELLSLAPHLVVSVHAPYGVLDFDGPLEAPRRLGLLPLDRVGVFPGSLGNYGGLHRGVPVITIELPESDQTPSLVDMLHIWTDLRQWMEARLRPHVRAREPGPVAAPAESSVPPPAVTPAAEPVEEPGPATPPVPAAPLPEPGPASVPRPASPPASAPSPSPAPAPSEVPPAPGPAAEPLAPGSTTRPAETGPASPPIGPAPEAPASAPAMGAPVPDRPASAPAPRVD